MNPNPYPDVLVDPPWISPKPASLSKELKRAENRARYAPVQDATVKRLAVAIVLQERAALVVKMRELLLKPKPEPWALPAVVAEEVEEGCW